MEGKRDTRSIVAVARNVRVPEIAQHVGGSLGLAILSTFPEIDHQIMLRQLDLVRGAISTAASAQPLRGRAPSVDDFERAAPAPPAVKRA